MILLSYLIAFSGISITLCESIYKAYVINIADRVKRLESIEKQLKHYDIPYEVFSAITPADLEKERELRSKELKSDRFDPNTKMNFLMVHYTPRPTEIGCTQSHVQILLKILKSETKDPVLILEDDAGLEEDFYNRSVNILKSIKGQWDILHVGYCHDHEEKCLPGGERALDYCQVVRQFIPCAQAYFVNGAKSASSLLNVVNTERPKIYDFMLSYSTDKYYISLPKLVIQLPFPSDNGNTIKHWLN